MLVWM